jgi:CRISPR-associated protein Cas1
MTRHLNTLFVTTPGARLRKQGQTVAVHVEGRSVLRVPLHNLRGIVCVGRITITPALVAACARATLNVTFLSVYGRFLATAHGYPEGNVLLRREQYRWADSPERSAAVARSIVVGKIVNGRTVLRRALRDHAEQNVDGDLSRASDRLGAIASAVSKATALEVVRGHEGEAAAEYFGVFDRLIVARGEGFRFEVRSRRPPLDPVNALLSFAYALLEHDCRAACMVAGLDPAVGFLHRDRPGRPGLALDLMEELRPLVADRVVLTVINRRQLSAEHFLRDEGGAVRMSDIGRRILLTAYQERKNEVITHPFLAEKMTLGLVAHVQALLLARHIRGDLDAYPPFAIT